MDGLKQKIIAFLPNRMVHFLLFWVSKIRFLKAKKRYDATKILFDSAEPNFTQLPLDQLKQLQGQYSFPPEYGYSIDILDKRGQERSKQLLAMVESKSCHAFLELGCWDGMVTYHLQKKGKKAIGIDARDNGFDTRALENGVDLRKMDAAQLFFLDESFDFVFSYDAFEHFQDPVAVLTEIYRVTKPGGYIYLEFGPLFNAPMGLHAYREITVPYCQHLFSYETLNAFLAHKKLEPIDLKHCNGWSLQQFRSLFEAYAGRLDKIIYSEFQSFDHLELVQKFADVMKSKTTNLDELLCDTIKVLFQKK
ncbi:class I SAM-dependent methyltransferase [Flavobacterium sp. CYK-55]|uniref:class I SAM-dependent methyltransferase n=1 Tax=Flavobacterium sp. CYK-55 TaxID=2835529 RepID=UPI001BCB3AC0|nr:class I SAM-dependent methyltransferase [Flavobacterium sp. CYK-55]MBS7785711.1 class I SAM-dependent methyltransferase [Flavobacterium sp. CYK-55]